MRIMLRWLLLSAIYLLVSLICSSCMGYVVCSSHFQLSRRNLLLASSQPLLSLPPLHCARHASPPRSRQPRHVITRYAVAAGKAENQPSSLRSRKKTTVAPKTRKNQDEVKFNVEDELAFLRYLFNTIAIDGRVSRDAYFSGKDVQFLLNRNLVDRGTLNELWDVVADDNATSSIGFQQYLALQFGIDQLVDIPDEMPERYRYGSLPNYNFSSSVDSIADLDIPGLYDLEMRQFLKDQFARLGNGAALISFEQFARWKPVITSCTRIGVKLKDIKDIWEEHAKEQRQQDGCLDVDAFIRFNSQIDRMVDSFRRSVVADLDKQPEVSQKDKLQAFDQWFTQLTGGNGLLKFDQFVTWSEISSRLKSGMLTEQRVRNLFDFFPYEAGSKFDEFGLSRASFRKLMERIDAELRQTYLTLRVERPPVPLPESDDHSHELFRHDMASLQTGNGGSSHQARVGDAQNDDTDEHASGPSSILTIANSRQSVFLTRSRDEFEVSSRINEHIHNLTTSDEWTAQNVSSIANLLTGEWQLILTNLPSVCERGGISTIPELLPTARFAGLTEIVSAPERTGHGNLEMIETISVVTGDIPVSISGRWSVLQSTLPFDTAPRITQRNRFDGISIGNNEPTMTPQQQLALQPLERLDVAFVDKVLKVMRPRSLPSSFVIFKRSSRAEQCSSSKLLQH